MSRSAQALPCRFSPRTIGLAAAIVTVLIWTSFILIARASADPAHGGVLTAIQSLEITLKNQQDRSMLKKTLPVVLVQNSIFPSIFDKPKCASPKKHLMPT